MASGYSPWWFRMLTRWCPWLFIECPGYNKHFRWRTYCCCCRHENSQGDYEWKDGKWSPVTPMTKPW
ncbi:MAG: hypothetical protein JSS66_07265 [Armatimonadetes bacterium]|nr:hypothetical protein [Armatimonadota bacterium]